MKKNILLSMAIAPALLLAGISSAQQQIEAVHGINFESTSRAEAALDTLFKDDAMKGGRATLYVVEFGESESSHLVVADFNNYAEYMERTRKRHESHGWSNYLLETQDDEYIGSTLVSVVDDHGAPRHTAGYLVAYLIHTTDAAAYRSAIADLAEAIENPGVLRLVAMRTGNRNVTHAVLIGGKDFAAVNEYLDKLFASDAFSEFEAKVGDTREVVGVTMYRRVATWGD